MFRNGDRLWSAHCAAVSFGLHAIVTVRRPLVATTGSRGYSSMGRPTISMSLSALVEVAMPGRKR